MKFIFRKYELIGNIHFKFIDMSSIQVTVFFLDISNSYFNEHYFHLSFLMGVLFHTFYTYNSVISIRNKQCVMNKSFHWKDTKLFPNITDSRFLYFLSNSFIICQIACIYQSEKEKRVL